jgi:PAS domain S-box-containing protein
MIDFKEINILVVDDEKIMREGSERILIKEGWKATTADSGHSGLELISKTDFQILLLDLMMPGISGMDVLKTVRKNHPDLLVIVITGYATIESAVEAMKNGAYDFIPKPFTPDQLRIVVRRAIDKLRLEREAEVLRLEKEKGLKDIANEKSRTLTIINHMADGIIVTDQNGHIVLYNPAVSRILGLEIELTIGKHISELIKIDEFIKMIEEILRAKKSEFYGSSLELALGNPPKKFLMAHSAPIHSIHGEVLGTVTIFNDVTFFKEIDQLKSDFVNMVSHELRSPLSALRQKLSLIVDGLTGDVNEEQYNILTRVQKRIDGLIGMIGNLLDLSRIEKGQLIQQKEKISLTEIIEEAVELMEPEAEEKGLSFDVTIDSQLSPIYADYQSMETVLKNLVNNSVKYNRAQGCVSINAQNKGDFIEIKVKDTGVGISKENLHRIFDKFFRIRNEYTRKVIGSGIGLPVVKAIIEAHSGSINVESEPEKGTTFTVLLPKGVS